MFGYLIVSDEYGMRPDGWEPIYKPDCGYVSLFNWDWCDAKDMINHGLVYPRNPSSHHTVPLSPSFSIRTELFVETEEKDSFFQLGYKGSELDLSKFREDAAPDAARDALQVYGEINAFYGDNFPYSSNLIVKGFYKTRLFEPDVDSGLWAGPIRLTKSALAAPRNGSLVIEAKLREVDSGRLIMDGNISFTFEEAIKCITGEGCSGEEVNRIMGEGCYFEVKVNWKYNKA
ncbi:hypothetical protein Tco_1290030 [Tanacetum coccineum]